MNFKFEIEHETEILLRARVTGYTPHRAPPLCKNPSSPAFSDFGDGEYIEFDLFFVINKKIAQKNSDGKHEWFNKEIEIHVPEEIYNLYEEEIYDLISAKAGDAFVLQYEEQETNRAIEAAEHRRDCLIDGMYEK